MEQFEKPTNAQNLIYNDYVDEHEPYYIKDWEITCSSPRKIVKNDNKSEIITFISDRYIEGVDLSTKIISIIGRNAKGQSFASEAENLYVSDDKIKFCWLVEYRTTMYAGTARFKIQFLDSLEEDTEDSKEAYEKNTTSCPLEVLDTVNFNSASLTERSFWYNDIIRQLAGYLDDNDANKEEINRVKKDIKSIEESLEDIEFLLQEHEDKLFEDIEYGETIEREQGKLYLVERKSTDIKSEIIQPEAVAYLRLELNKKIKEYDYYTDDSVDVHVGVSHSARDVGAVTFDLPCTKGLVKKAVLTMRGVSTHQSKNMSLPISIAPYFDKNNNEELSVLARKLINCDAWEDGINEYDSSLILTQATLNRTDWTYTIDLTNYINTLANSDDKIYMVFSNPGTTVNSGNWIRLSSLVSNYELDIEYYGLYDTIEDSDGNDKLVPVGFESEYKENTSTTKTILNTDRCIISSVSRNTGFEFDTDLNKIIFDDGGFVSSYYKYCEVLLSNANQMKMRVIGNLSFTVPQPYDSDNYYFYICTEDESYNLLSSHNYMFGEDCSLDIDVILEVPPFGVGSSIYIEVGDNSGNEKLPRVFGTLTFLPWVPENNSNTYVQELAPPNPSKNDLWIWNNIKRYDGKKWIDVTTV